MKLRAVRRVHFIATISRARRDHPNRRRGGLHRANLHRRSVRAEQSSIRQIKCVLLVPRGMFGWRVQRVEAVPFVLNVWTISERETHSPENLNRSLEHLGERMQSAELVRRAGQ